MAELLSRSVHEERAYMQMHPCQCGDQTVKTWSGEAVHSVTGAHRSYWWTCPTCRTARRFDFYTPKERRAASTQPYGNGRSAILDPGQWLVLAERYAELAADRALSREDRRENRWLAPAAIQEVLKFIPPETAEVPPRSFTSETGRAIRLAGPEAFRRESLEHRARRYAKGQVVHPVRPSTVAKPGVRDMAARNWYPDIIRSVLMVTVPLIIGGAIVAWAGGGSTSATYFTSVTVAVVSTRLGQFAGEEVGFALSAALMARQYGVSPSLFVVPWRGAGRLHRIWRSVLWLAAIAAAGGYLAGWLPRAAWITTDLAVLSALVAGLTSYHTSLRKEARAALYRYRNEISGSPSRAEPPVRRPSRLALPGSAALAGCVTVFAATVGDRAASGSPVFWVVVGAVLLAALEPLTSHRAESISERITEAEPQRRHEP